MMGLDLIEVLITLVIILLVAGGKRLRDRSRNVQGSFDAAEVDTTSPRTTMFLVAGFFAVTLPSVLWRVHAVSGKQTVVMLFVFVSWLMAAYFRYFEEDWD
ncbi:MAG: hypothetical protein ACKVX9_15530 [Blastocatellia bacterium]